MNLASREREQLCQLLHDVGPDAPTLCEGWQTHDLAAHLWVRENDPVAVPGMGVKPLRGITARRMQRVLDRLGYDGVVDDLAKGPKPWSLFHIGRVNETANMSEYFVHHEDVRRAGAEPRAPRDISRADQDSLWRMVKAMAKLAARPMATGLALVRSDTGERVVVKPGDVLVTMEALPAEMLLYLMGRRDQADVKLVGEDAALKQFRAGFQK